MRDGSKAHPERGGCVEAMWLVNIDSIPRRLLGRGGRETLEGSLGWGGFLSTAVWGGDGAGT